MTPKGGLYEREIQKGLRSEVIAPMALPSLGSGHRLTTSEILASARDQYQTDDLPEEVVSGGIVEQIEGLLFAKVNLHRTVASVYIKLVYSTGGKTDQRCTGDHQTRDEESEGAPLCSVDQSIPSEDIEVGHAVHMSRINLSSERVDEVVLDEKGVPGVDEVDGGIVSDLKVTVQTEEPLE